MILLRATKVKEWLKAIEKNQSWLAEQLNIKKAYISLIMHNRCQISKPIISKLMALSHIQFEGLFYSTNEEEGREFYGKQIFWRGKMLDSKDYVLEIQKILEKVNGKNI